MKKIAGIGGLLIVVMAITGAIDFKFFSPYNITNIMRWTGLFGILSLGEALVTITGGIDLSVGSVVGLIGSLLPMFLTHYGMSIGGAILICVCISLAIGLIHGFLITRLKMQPFIVTLCGLFVYRGLARYFTHDVTQSFGNGFTGLKALTQGSLPASLWSHADRVPRFIQSWSIPMPFVIMVVVGLILWLLLKRSIYGRYIFALGNNEKAARFSGVNTNRMTMLAYVICSLLAGLGAILFSLYINSSQPSSQGIFFELYAIAGAVLGGCSLRGGEGSIAGVILGTAVVRVLYNVINILGIATQLEYAVVGIVILGGVAADDLVKLYSGRRRIRSQAMKRQAVGTGLQE